MDTEGTHEGKVSELQRLDSWLLKTDDPQPTCSKGGSKSKAAPKQKAEVEKKESKKASKASDSKKADSKKADAKKSSGKKSIFGKRKHQKLETGDR